MIALVLCAGFGTRLLPHTRHRPKPLFTLNRQPILGITIDRLLASGCSRVLVNTHHLADQINAFIKTAYPENRVLCIHEPVILDTGGAIRNIRDHIGSVPFFVVNGDIVFDIDLAAVWKAHCQGDWPATLVLHDCNRFNTVTVDSHGFIRSFRKSEIDPPPSGHERLLAFTGIQVLSSEIFRWMPTSPEPFSSIDLYSTLCASGRLVKGYVVHNSCWNDIGSIQAYQEESLRHLAAAALDTSPWSQSSVKIEALAGDGSDRQWYRASTASLSVVLVSHGIQTDTTVTSEFDSFVAIGTHLDTAQVPVPKILGHDRVSGLVALEDLGDTHLQDVVPVLRRSGTLKNTYESIILQALNMSIRCGREFDPAWAFQTPQYDVELILSRECMYFLESFVQGYLGRQVSFSNLEPEFRFIAEQGLKDGLFGFLHRDLQSRNIMAKNGRFYFIDFQGGRIGPFQYDLASLLMDPYADIAPDLAEDLLLWSAAAGQNLADVHPESFIRSFRYLSLTRLMQMLGAFSFLSQTKGKLWFETWIPGAVKRLKLAASHLDPVMLKQVKTLINSL